jgi:hypothetical protein
MMDGKQPKNNSNSDCNRMLRYNMIASIFRVEEQAKQETSVKAGGKGF